MAGGKYHTWLASAMPSIPHVLTHLSHRHPLRWAALQENFMVQGHFLAQRLLIKVLAQVWEKGKGSKAPSGQGREEARTVYSLPHHQSPPLLGFNSNPSFHLF